MDWHSKRFTLVDIVQALAFGALFLGMPLGIFTATTRDALLGVPVVIVLIGLLAWLMDREASRRQAAEDREAQEMAAALAALDAQGSRQ
jgi:hypothetical protein